LYSLSPLAGGEGIFEIASSINSDAIADKAFKELPEVVKHLKATGRGWQTRIDESLKKLIAPRKRPASKV
jgi:hypothetical protein